MQRLLFPDAFITEPSGLVPHPIPYQGSKRQLAAKILVHFPRQFQRLVEPFAGSAALSLAAAYHGRAGAFWINDAHRPLIVLWNEILKHPEELAAKYAALWQDRWDGGEIITTGFVINLTSRASRNTSSTFSRDA